VEDFRVGVSRETFLPFGLEPLDRAGVPWEWLAEEVPELTPQLFQGYDALVHFFARITPGSLEGVERLALIARHGVGLDMVDLDACTERGIAVTITPDGIRRPMASAAVAFILALSHQLVERNSVFHSGRWEEDRFGVIGFGLNGRTLGVIGFGNIGRDVVALMEPWGMRVVVSTPHPTDEPGVTHVQLDELLAEADVVVVTCPLKPETYHLLDARRLALMKPTAVLVNVARGAIVDQAALVEALRAGRLGGAGLDVFEKEPVPPGDSILGLPKVVAAPHSLGYTDQLLRGCVESACASILAVRDGRVPEHLANPAVLDRPEFEAKLKRFKHLEIR
jgi:phosphoglycerate dehydrogenase-like enzyme